MISPSILLMTWGVQVKYSTGKVILKAHWNTGAQCKHISVLLTHRLIQPGTPILWCMYPFECFYATWLLHGYYNKQEIDNVVLSLGDNMCPAISCYCCADVLLFKTKLWHFISLLNTEIISTRPFRRLLCKNKSL